MMTPPEEPSLTTAFDNGFPFADIPDGGSIEGTIAGDAALLVRRGETVYAVGAHCTHYRGPLGRGLVVGETIRCPLHHACFSLTTGEALRAPAFDPIDCWDVERVRLPRTNTRSPTYRRHRIRS